MKTMRIENSREEYIRLKEETEKRLAVVTEILKNAFSVGNSEAK